jgi:hypothetical protein
MAAVVAVETKLENISRHYCFDWRMSWTISAYRGYESGRGSDDADYDRDVENSGTGLFIANHNTTSPKEILERIRNELRKWKDLEDDAVEIKVIKLFSRDPELEDDLDDYDFVYDEFEEEEEKMLKVAHRVEKNNGVALPQPSIRG